MESKRFGCWDFIILIFSIFSLSLIPLQMLHKGSEDILIIIDSADIVLCSFCFLLLRNPRLSSHTQYRQERKSFSHAVAWFQSKLQDFFQYSCSRWSAVLQ
ncbi:MAG: hypothetical protein EBZ05_08260, partial [Verrucomicrobia bacterium]|nr:hypothetical protein [Verrucomicrobiota bacterium]